MSTVPDPCLGRTETKTVRLPLFTACTVHVSFCSPFGGIAGRYWVRCDDQSSGSTYVPGSSLSTLR